MKPNQDTGIKPKSLNIFRKFSLAEPIRRWALARLPRNDQLTLTQSNVYILPSRAGWAMLATLIVLLIAAINYQLNLGYLLTFLLAGSAAASMVVGHGNLRGLQLGLQSAGNHGGSFAHAPCPVHIKLHNSRKLRRWGIGLSLREAEKTGADAWTWVDVPEQGDTSLQLRFVPGQRGQHALPAVSILTRYPLGAFRVWALWRPAGKVWVYPAPETNPPPLPAASPEAGGRSSAQVRSGEEFDGVRAYQSGDPLKLVVWKKAAQSFAAGGHQLVSRDRPFAHHHRLWLDARATGLADHEARLSRLTAWVLLAQQQGRTWGLRLPNGQEIAPDSGAQHATRCLEALAIA
ncbi:DUF58 domain-containing protein [Comamonas testosteroni]|uniref:DUF58 domain-containing protein n=1 Tax=Comamonas testosteroni TaxID=285 RepID=A0A373F7N4_COMTE|nr:DUF58 domain-containing protein [Comamonas testosteroni]RGE39967.1 DUF58 domain-containing protein [Comamonas testosteroni]